MTDAVLSGVLAGNANAVSMLFTNPLDVAKIRFQTTAQGRGLTQTDKVSTVGNVIRIFRQEGVRGIYKGICISMIREQTYSAARFGLYEPFKVAIGGDGAGNSFWKKLAAGLASGGLAAAIFTPVDVLKVRYMADRSPKGQPPLYPNLRSAVAVIYRNEGVANGLYKGMGTTVIRSSVLNCAQVATYDQSKQSLLVLFPAVFQEGIWTHFAASFVSGFCCAAASNPFDVTRTRIMNDMELASHGRGQYSKSSGNSFVQTFVVLGKIAREEGMRGLFKGFVPAYVRLGSSSMTMFLIYEQLRLAAGLKPM